MPIFLDPPSLELSKLTQSVPKYFSLKLSCSNKTSAMDNTNMRFFAKVCSEEH